MKKIDKKFKLMTEMVENVDSKFQEVGEKETFVKHIVFNFARAAMPEHTQVLDEVEGISAWLTKRSWKLLAKIAKQALNTFIDEGMDLSEEAQEKLMALDGMQEMFDKMVEIAKR